jgi:hypothetical protein
LIKVQFFNDKKFPYQLRNLSAEKNKRVYRKMLKELAVLLKDTEDPWYEQKILGGISPYKSQ